VRTPFTTETGSILWVLNPWFITTKTGLCHHDIWYIQRVFGELGFEIFECEFRAIPTAPPPTTAISKNLIIKAKNTTIVRSGSDICNWSCDSTISTNNSPKT
jgi:hypothetical protein